MRRLLAVAVLLALTAPAAALDAADRSVEAGRVGAIVKGATKPDDLARLYGAGNVVSQQVHLGEGEHRPGALIYRGTDNALEVLFSADAKSIAIVRVKGKAWKTKEGIRLGTTVAELEKINGGPFKFLGFRWDGAGNVMDGGKLPRGVRLAIAATKNSETKQASQLDGDREFTSRHPALKNLAAVVSAMSVDFED